MSTNAPQTHRPGDDPWNPRRIKAGFRRVRLVGHGRNRHYEFDGQQTGEEIKLVLRKHIWFLITPAFPLIGSIIALIVVSALRATYPQAAALWTLLIWLFVILIIAAFLYFVVHDLILWWVEIGIITNRRVIRWKGYLSPERDEATLEQVVQVEVNQNNLLSMLLSYGDVHFNLIGGRGFVMYKVPNPKEVRDRFTKVFDQFKQSKPAAPPHPVPGTSDVRQVLAELSKKDPLPVELQLPPNPDKKYRHREDENGHIYPPSDSRTRGPLRTFGGPLRLPCDVAYTADEDTVMYIQRAKSVLVLRLIWRVLVLILSIMAAIFFSSVALAFIIFSLLWLLYIGYTIVNYIDDVFILTTKRIIDIDRKFLFFNEEHITTEYSNIRDVTVNVGNPLYLALDVGMVTVQTPGNNPNIEISPADHPFSIQDIIYNLKGRKEKVDKLKAKNDQKEVLNQWFGTVLATMEKTVLGRGVPNLLKLDYFTAGDRARAAHWRVVVSGEDSSYPNIESGLIVYQDPLPGAFINGIPDPDKPEEWPVIRVKLSSRAKQA